MKERKLKKNTFITIAYIVLLVTIPITLLFSKLIGYKMGEHIKDTMRNSAQLCADIIERQYTSDMLMLEGLAVRMSITFESNPTEAIERLISTAERYGMKRLAFSTPDGFTYTTDYVPMDLTGISNFEHALAGNPHLTTVISDEADGDEVNIYSVPVYGSSTEEIIGVMSAVYYSNSFRELLSAYTFNGSGYTYIIDTRGNIVIDSNHPDAVLGHEYDNIFSYMESAKHNESEIIALKQNIQSRGEGFCELNNQASGNRFAYYMPLEINNWYVLTVVPKNVAEANKKAVMLSVSIYCICISLVAIYVVISIRHAQSEKNKLLKKALYEDKLTGGRSHEKFLLDCRNRIQATLELRAVCAILAIDNFNLVSSLHGNEKSNATIVRIHEIVQESVGDKGIVCRIGFCQFCIMYFYDDFSEIQACIQAFNRALAAEELFENMLHASLGIYVIENREESIDDMMSKARIALESSKLNPNSSTAYYDENYRNAMYEAKHLEDEMVSALDRHEFVPYLQPKYDAASGNICGAETLIRWITSDGTIISPGRFIPLAENNGFVRMLDREMFTATCSLLKQLIDNGITPVPISVNISRQLMYDANFVEDYYNKMQEMGLPTDLIELEITESIFFENYNVFRNTLERLRNYGFRILMDDFGTGYSSLMMLKSVPIDQLKLDKTFVDDYNDKKGRDIIRCILELAKRLELPVIAEGVETEHQYDYLKKMGCNVIQGYYFSKPIPSAEFVQKLM